MKSVISTVLLSALAVSAAPGLVLDVAGPSSVVDLNGLTVKATLKNTGDVALKLLNDPRTVLSKARTNTFSISSPSGTPKFTGLYAKYVPSKAVADAKESTFTVLAPGQSIEVEHNLGGVYNFTQSGEGAYSFTANNLFNYVDESGELKTIEASSNSHQFKLAGKLAVSNGHISSISRRAVSYTGCTSNEQSQISTAATSSNTYVADVNSYLAGISSGTTRYTTWFGTFSTSRHNTVVSHYKDIGTDATNTNYDCTACKSESGIDYESTFAYVNPDSPGKINLCGQFWSAPNTGADSRAGTIVHENSHFTVNGGTEDHVYGQGAAKSLAQSDPDQAINNADNHEYFAENTPALS
ncbi:deuterolysin metalloprotease (M35) family containing protein [Rhizoctonia solani 123E]|uniref:Deuterolysin metalloprotease (M35) family containing protein n=1 Tax=Rhizoctonia solani 123E TaxID=1423351 RepID=A0A074S545_9AGAM|nr:deuterolysin metalloprotease (M35) family containing protein [Rhizoctonia solani 123E]